MRVPQNAFCQQGRIGFAACPFDDVGQQNITWTAVAPAASRREQQFLRPKRRDLSLWLDAAVKIYVRIFGPMTKPGCVGQQLVKRDGVPRRRRRFDPAADGIGHRQHALFHQQHGGGSRELFADRRELEPSSRPAGLAGLMVGETGVRLDYPRTAPQHHECARKVHKAPWVRHQAAIRPTNGRPA